MTAPVALTCSACGSKLLPAEPGQRYIQCKFCNTSFDTGAPPPAAAAPLARGNNPFAAGPFPPSPIVAPKTSFIADAVVGGIMVVSIMGTMISQCVASRRAGDAAAQAAAAAEQKASASDGARASGTISINSIPKGTKVLLDGKEMPNSPLWWNNLAIGPHTVRVEGNDPYAPFETTVTLVAKQSQNLGDIKPRLIKGKATIRARGMSGALDPGAVASLVSGSDKRDLPELPATLDLDLSQSWTLVATRPGCVDFSQPIAFDDDKPEKTFTVELSPKPSNPDGSDGAIPRAVAQRIADAGESRLRYCFANASGMSSFRVQVDENGHVTSPTPDRSGDPKKGLDFMRNCIADGIAKWHFPKAKIPTNFSLSFQYNSDVSLKTAVIY